ncbi:MAG: hypothetical protein HKO07_05380 [Pseudomonadales bacterium]|nr:hypothetical protein [Pseudomonadales bacterium]
MQTAQGSCKAADTAASNKYFNIVPPGFLISLAKAGVIPAVAAAPKASDLALGILLEKVIQEIFYRENRKLSFPGVKLHTDSQQ